MFIVQTQLKSKMSKIDLTAAESKATYEQIKVYC